MGASLFVVTVIGWVRLADWDLFGKAGVLWDD
jgi:hypothetical protein